MEQFGTLFVLYLVGAGILVAEIFIPSHGILTVAGLGFLATAIVMTFRVSESAGYVAVLLAIILLPTAGLLAVKYWHRTPVGRRISPPNPVVTAEDTGNWKARLQPFVGKVGRSMSQLRPVGTCDFDGERLECIAEMGVIDRGKRVKAVGLRERNLSVVEVDEASTA